MTFKQGIAPLVKVGLARYRVGEAPMRMMTMALGSCLGIVLFDPEACIGAMAHVMHPSRENVKNNYNKAKFVDSAIALMLDRMLKREAVKERICAKIFGGARMFDHLVGNSDIPQIGDRNVSAARAELKMRGIPITKESVGGNIGRTIIFDLSNGSVCVRYAYNKEEIL
ncbi:MAG: chemotaxis protein CheD [Candidatus Krumholzibacteria bacterium]|nr:chemotaxis protein CheD [Candidatus Krumholzibacteria bacterium]